MTITGNGFKTPRGLHESVKGKWPWEGRKMCVFRAFSLCGPRSDKMSKKTMLGSL